MFFYCYIKDNDCCGHKCLFVTVIYSYKILITTATIIGNSEHHRENIQ